MPESIAPIAASAVAPQAPGLLDAHVAHLLRRAHQRASARLLEAIDEHRLTPTQVFALCRLYELGRLSQNHLGRLAAMDPATIQGVIQRLHERGYVARDRDPGDRRRIILSLSPAGEALFTALRGAVLRAHDATLASLSAEEREHLVRLLEKIG